MLRLNGESVGEQLLAGPHTVAVATPRSGPQRASYSYESYATFEDSDGNGRTLQWAEKPATCHRLPEPAQMR